MATIKTPKMETLLRIGDSEVYVFDVEDDAREYGAYGYRNDGRTHVIAHDDDGNEVDIYFYPRQPEDGWPEDEDDDA